jgi:probable HAF family extracellular repeat protein
LDQLRKVDESKIMKLRLTALLAVGLVAGTVPSLAQTYSIKDLGAVAGDSVSKGYSLNDLGQAAGTSSNPSGAIPTLFSGGKAINLGTLVAGDVAVATGINESAEVVGYEFEYSNGGDGLSHGVLYRNGALLDLHSPSLFPSGTTATAINGSGVVVGHGQLDYYSFHVFLYSNGQMVDLGPPGSFQAAPAAINDAGQIIGSYYTSSTDNGAFLYSNGKFTNLGAPAGTSTSAAAINSTGQIAGTIRFNNGAPPHAALYNNGVWTDLGGVPGAVSTGATGINSAGQIIASAGFPVKSYHPFVPGKHVPLIVRNGGLVNLNTLISSNSGFTLTDAIAINDAGQILCNANNTGGHQRAVLLTPN